MPRKLLNETIGATAIEYAVAAYVVLFAAVASCAALGVQSAAKFTAVGLVFGGT